MPKRKSIVPLTEPSEARQIFDAELGTGVTDVRGEPVRCDIGDFAHITLDHEEMPRRMRWIRETLTNPEAIYRHYSGKLQRYSEIYVNAIFESAEDEEGTPHVVMVDRQIGFLRLRTSFVPRGDYLESIEEGDLLWQAEE